MSSAAPSRRLASLVGAVLLLATFGAVGGQETVRGPERALPGELPGGTGRLVSFRLRSAPFPHRARSRGYTYDGDSYSVQGHYDDSSVAVFIPEGFRPTGQVDLVFFFHGWFSSIQEALQSFSLIKQFSSSGAQALLVIPETARDAPDSFGGKLEEPGGFDQFVRELLARLATDMILPASSAGRITLVGHSGAYHVIARILGQTGEAAKVREVCLFDALYEDVPRYERWIVHGDGRFVSICAEEGDPADNAQTLAERLRATGLPVASGDDDPDRDKEVLDNRIVFLRSPYDHEGLVSTADEFKRVLAVGVSRR